MIGIYVIRCVETDDCFIGKTENHVKEWENHKELLKQGKDYKWLQEAYGKYGLSSLRFAMLEICQPEDLEKLLEEHITFHNPYYNRSLEYCGIGANDREVEEELKELEELEEMEVKEVKQVVDEERLKFDRKMKRVFPDYKYKID